MHWISCLQIIEWNVWDTLSINKHCGLTVSFHKRVDPCQYIDGEARADGSGRYNHGGVNTCFFQPTAVSIHYQYTYHTTILWWYKFLISAKAIEITHIFSWVLIAVHWCLVIDLTILESYLVDEIHILLNLYLAVSINAYDVIGGGGFPWQNTQRSLFYKSHLFLSTEML